MGSSFDIRNLQKGFTMYNNTFERIISNTAPVVHISGFENTLSKIKFQ